MSRSTIRILLLVLLAGTALPACAQTAFTGSFADFANATSGTAAARDGAEAMADAEVGAAAARREVTDAEHAANRGALDMGVERTAWGLNVAASASEFLRDYGALAGTDEACTLTDPGPRIPSSCGEAGSECHACYERATGALNANRATLHRAWCITHTNLTMAKSAIAFGDSSSGVHGVAGLSWSLSGKPQIEEGMASLRKTYARRQGDFVNAIDRNLKDLGQCEAEHFGERDWYTRFGYIYLDHVRVRYASAEP